MATETSSCASYLVYHIVWRVILSNYHKTSFELKGQHILGDPGAVTRVGRKGGTKVFKYGRKSPWVPTLTELFPKIQADAGS